MKRFLSIILSLAMVFSLSTTTFAAESSDYHIVCDNISMRVAEETIDSVKYIYTFEKETNTLKTETYNVSNELTSTKYLDLSSVSTDYSVYGQQSKLASRSYYQHTFSNYEYDQLGNNKFQLRNKDTYVIRYLSSDKDAIDRYIEAVDTLNAAELAVLAAGGTTVLWTVLTYLDGGLTAGEAATAAGAVIGEVTALNLAINNCKRVWRLYVA
ncbi:MAG: geobacillin-26 family protein [Epulopiscium sp.]|nr:geobacillin-26 family protein [Candidatus Epulonipiscium sp.]